MRSICLFGGAGITYLQPILPAPGNCSKYSAFPITAPIMQKFSFFSC